MSVYSPYTKKYQNPNPISEKTISISVAKEEEKKIAAMGLGELKDYACPKALQHNKDWYITCVSCPGVDSCKPGRRVMEILENDTKPEEKVSAIDKFNNRYNNALKLCGKEAYLDAIQHEDPVQYYMDLHHVPKSSALERFRRWKIAYPDVQVPVIKKLPHKNTGVKAEQNNEVSEKTRAVVEAAFTYPDGVFAYFINVLNVSIRAIIRGRVYNWVNAYPDLDKKYRIKDWVRATRGTPGRKAGFEEPEGFLPNIGSEKKDEPASDDISVDEFLAEIDGVQAEDYGKEIDPVEESEEVPVEETEKVETIADESSDTIADTVKAEDDSDKKNRIAACLVFSEKRIEIIKAINERRIALTKLKEELDDLNTKLNKLDAAADILGFVIER